jgi:hypothetical protein
VDFDAADITRPLRNNSDWGYRQARIAGLDFPFVGAPVEQRLDRIEFALVEISHAISRLAREIERLDKTKRD